MSNDRMRVIYWAKLSLGRAEIPVALGGVAGAEIEVVESFEAMLDALPGAKGLILPDVPVEMALQIVARLTAPENTLVWMHILTAGREGFEAAGLPQGLAITGSGAALSPTVAEHGMALLLSLVRQIPRVVELQSQRNWARLEVSPHARSLEGMRLAIVGYGRIGCEVARRARGFGMHIIGLSRSAKPDDMVDESLPMSALDSVLERVDAIMLTVPLTPQTHHLVNKAFLDRCKRGAILVNISRGGVVDQEALSAALTDGRLSAAAIDASDPEPLPAKDQLWDAPNLIISPHFAGAGSHASTERLAAGAAENLRRMLAEEPLQNRLN